MDTCGHVSSVCTLDLFTCAPFSVSCVFRQESVVFPGLILISFGFSELPRAPAPLCDHGPYSFDKGKCEKTTATTTTTPNLFRTYKNLFFSCFDNNALCILFSKLYHIIAHPPLGARGAERGVGARGYSNNSPTLSSVTLSQVPSQLAMSSFRRQPPMMVFGSAYGRSASMPYPLCCTSRMRTSRYNFVLSAWHVPT